KVLAAPDYPQGVGGWCASEFLAEAALSPARTKTIAGVNVDLDLPSFRPEAVAKFPYVRFVYNVSQHATVRDLQKAHDRYRQPITTLLNEGVTPVITFNHQ